MTIVIVPSMGFGTGHHATTRLCLAALQAVDATGRVAVDLGTGSGVLALAARLLGASKATGIDHDPDAIQAARENLEANPAVDQVTFQVADLRDAPLPVADLVTANLTGALLIRSAPQLMAALTPNGELIVSGLLRAERDEVVRAFAPMELAWEGFEDEWAALRFTAPATPTSQLE